MLADPTRVPMYPDLGDKVAVVTGSSRGIGAATARLLAVNGTRVAVNGRDKAAIDNTLGEIRSAGGQALGVVAYATNVWRIFATDKQGHVATVYARFFRYHEVAK